MFGLFKDKKSKKTDEVVMPEIMGLRMGCSFELDALHLKLIEKELLSSGIAHTQIIEAVGRVDLDDTSILRFYTDDEAFLQVVCQGPLEEDNVIDVKLFHYYSTADVSSDRDWNDLLRQKMGVNTYTIDGQVFTRVWESTGDYHQPVAMTEKTYAENGTISKTDQFIMLFERFIDEENTESIMLSAEEVIDEHNNVSRCLVISSGITISSSQISIHG